MAESDLEPIFFELSWSILSTIGASNVFFGLVVGCVANFSLIALVPIVTSTACAFANGLCFYAYYLTSLPAANRAAAAVFADIAWLIQEAGLSFYSYLILRRVLRHTSRVVFITMFWSIMLAIATVRVMIAQTRARLILNDDTSLQKTINRLHMAYFPLIALVECLSAYFLLSTFARAKTTGIMTTGTRMGLFRYLMRSTEIRLALLAIIGIMRAVTYSFQVDAQSATHTASQVDRFAYTLECLFPMIMYIDMLSSKVVHMKQHHEISIGAGRLNSSRTPRRRSGGPSVSSKEKQHRDDFGLPKGRVSHHMGIGVVGSAGFAFGEGSHRRTSSQELIIFQAPGPRPKGGSAFCMGPSGVELLPPMAACKTR
ncbi:hypothetical protein VTJ83DRAFT_6078 [Remersonia thermophila]|uniref:Uncharacterized protein n=1 Tax=Remersonia thermophila TaxID=72144 RepID=A0ABR4D8Q6_9PEZI